VVSEIVLTPNLKHRQSIIKHFINIAKHSYDLQNYGGLLEIVYGLRHTAIQRMKSSWNLPDKCLSTLKQLAEIVSPDSNWYHLRKHMDVTVKQNGFVPYLGLYLSDLTFIKDGGGGTIPDNGHVAWDKHQKIYDVLHSIQTVQSRDLIEEIQPDSVYQIYFGSELCVIEETVIYKLSKTREAK